MYIALFIIIVGLVGIITMQHLMLKRRAKLFKTHLQHVALPYFKSQMNPHFIKNLLQTINYFILFDSKENASKYLKKFSVLVDKTLKLADVELISLADEIEILELYLELQNQRFPNKFDFIPISTATDNLKPTITVAGNINPLEIKIPPMVVQPFVENAIVHGLEPKSTKGLINISFSQESNLMICRITDNGIGRKASQRFKKSNNNGENNGIGLKNVFQRLSLIEETLNISIHLDVSNLNDDEEDTGTVITLKLPAKFPKATNKPADLDSMIQLQSKYMTKFMR